MAVGPQRPPFPAPHRPTPHPRDPPPRPTTCRPTTCYMAWPSAGLSYHSLPTQLYYCGGVSHHGCPLPTTPHPTPHTHTHLTHLPRLPYPTTYPHTPPGHVYCSGSDTPRLPFWRLRRTARPRSFTLLRFVPACGLTPPCQHGCRSPPAVAARTFWFVATRTVLPDVYTTRYCDAFSPFHTFHTRANIPTCGFTPTSLPRTALFSGLGLLAAFWTTTRTPLPPHTLPAPRAFCSRELSCFPARLMRLLRDTLHAAPR